MNPFTELLTELKRWLADTQQRLTGAGVDEQAFDHLVGRIRVGVEAAVVRKITRTTLATFGPNRVFVDLADVDFRLLLRHQGPIEQSLQEFAENVAGREGFHEPITVRLRKAVPLAPAPVGRPRVQATYLVSDVAPLGGPPTRLNS